MMRQLTRIALLETLRAHVRERKLRYSDLLKIVDGDPVMLSAHPMPSLNHHRTPGWERMLIWARQLELELCFEAMPIEKETTHGAEVALAQGSDPSRAQSRSEELLHSDARSLP